METPRQKEKKEAIKKEISRLKRIIKNIPDDKKKAAEGLIQEAAFMRATLGELREIIDRDGPLDLFEQGDYAYNREHPAVKSYNTMVQRYSAICKLIFDLLPTEDKSKTATDELMDFVKKARK